MASISSALHVDAERELEILAKGGTHGRSDLHRDIFLRVGERRMHLVDDIDLVASADRGELNAALVKSLNR